MSTCDITSGFSLGCRDNAGGIKNIYILSGSIDSIVGSDNGLITSIVGAGEFFKFELNKQSGDLTETINSSIENGTVFYDQIINAPFHKLQSSTRNQVKVLAQAPQLKIIVETNNGVEDSVGVNFLVGQNNGMTLSGGSGQTGTGFGDLNGYTLTFNGQEPLPMSEVSGSSIADILTGITVS
tara:strand:+ start:270 stop:815 length:546 start_codon:yes stop_codon:yes gene_type:complete